MSECADAVVVGGGVNGACVAYHLAELGARRVVVLDAGNPDAATARSGAMLTLHHHDLADSLLAHAGLRSLREFTERTGLPTGFTRCGIVQLFPLRFTDAVRRNVRRQQEAGIPIGVLSPAELGELLPAGTFDDVGCAVVEPESGYAAPSTTTRSYLRAALRAGAVLHRTAAHGLVVNRGRVTGVRTGRGRIRAPVVVVAAGAWSPELLAGAGVELALNTRRVRIARFRVAPGAWRGRPVLLDQVRSSWIRPDTEETVLAGLELGLPAPYPSPGEKGIEPWYSNLCRGRLTERFPVLGGAREDGGWSGLISMSPDGRPVADRLAEVDGLYCVAGDSGTSFKLAPVMGKRLAEWIVEGAPRGPDLAPLTRSRLPTARPSDGYGRFSSAAKLAREIRRSRQPITNSQEVDRRDS
ncbi:FAD-binding oxidoreductase [Streptomyces sp. MBT53]|uniref:NAD(P)/FAD-dependent oxidoreductase n=1 Tax=Streptomyces sp. MBT53 TaxID=1488384 RepID=UPI00191268DE|nr:FAD-binding oxidoreductase [Streptomyces sp. MBT53]MBK6015412.1 FAD-binding oxidoreductase [Streptomyces sp. MBT53]